jgi:hypothetical protein
MAGSFVPLIEPLTERTVPPVTAESACHVAPVDET